MNCTCEKIISLLNEILNAINANSSSFSETFFSAFLGFGFALLVEALVDLRNTKHLKNQITFSLLEELKKVESTVNSLKPNKAYFQPYSISMWKGACASGSVLSLQNNKNFTELINVFSTIEEANIIEKECLSNIMRLSENNSLDEEEKVNEFMDSYIKVLEDSRKKVRKQVVNGIKILGGSDN